MEAWIKRAAVAEMTEQRRLLVVIKTQPEPWPPDGKIAKAPKCTFWCWESQGSLNPPPKTSSSLHTTRFIFLPYSRGWKRKKRNTCSSQREQPWQPTGPRSLCLLSFQPAAAPLSPLLRFAFSSRLWAFHLFSHPHSHTHICFSITSHLLHVHLSVTSSRDVLFFVLFDRLNWCSNCTL